MLRPRKGEIMPANPTIDEASRPGGSGGPDPACLVDGYVFDPASGFHWHPYATHWFHPAMGIYLDPEGALLDAGTARAAAHATAPTEDPADGAPMAVHEDVAVVSSEDAPYEVESEDFGAAPVVAEEDLPTLSMESIEVTGTEEAAEEPHHTPGPTLAPSFPQLAVALPGPAAPFEAAEAGPPEETSDAPAAALFAAPSAVGIPLDHLPDALDLSEPGVGAADAAPLAMFAPEGDDVVPLDALAEDPPEPQSAEVPEDEVVEMADDAVPLPAPPPSDPDLLDPASLPTLFEDPWRVVVHLRTGAAKRGEFNGADLRSTTVLLHHAGGSDFIDTEAIKAIFFMREAHMPARRPGGRRVRITLSDGRALEGYAPQKLPATGGFYVVPADDRTNTAWIFVYPHAIRDLAFA